MVHKHLFETPKLRRHIRGEIAEAAKLAAQRKLIYTEGAYRWDGIANKRRYQHGETPHYADCSALATWTLWTSTRYWHHLGDFVNGQNWGGGYTGTMVQHGIDIGHESELLVADMIFYGGTYDVPAHVAIYVGNGHVISNGGIAGDPQMYPTDLNGALPIQRYKRYIY